MADQQRPNPIPAASGFTAIGNELDPTAPLWRVYRDEVRHHDQNVTFDEWNKTLDILLIFAGLFSAVVTSFLVASYPLLNPEDGNEAVVNAIHALAMAINSSITLPTPEPPEPVTASALWANGLWFASLFMALAVAFFAILAKQWLVEYNHRMADPPAAVASARHGVDDSTTAGNAAPSQPPSHSDVLFPTASLQWARRRQFYFAAFTNWHIPVLVTQVLPFLLHVALFLFLVGLSVFVWTLNGRIARGISALTGLLFSLYLIATVLPVFRADCPTATPLIRRARETPTWIALKAVQLWSLILPVVLRASGSSRFTSRSVKRTLDDLCRRQKHIRDSGWLESEGTTDDEVKLDTLRWLILVSGSETAITAAFQALGALPANSPFLPALTTITTGMETAVERLGNSIVPPTAAEIIRAVRSELFLGRGSWDLPLLGLDLSSSLTKTLGESQHPYARLLSAAMHLDGTLYVVYEGWKHAKKRSFSSLYDITESLLRGEGSSDASLSTARLLLNRPGISVPAFACLSVLLARSLHLDDSDKALIFRVFRRLRKASYLGCNANDAFHSCDGLCVVVFMVWDVDMEDPASRRIVPIVLSHILPCLMPELGYDGPVPHPLSQNGHFFSAIARSDWLHSPRPAGDSDVRVLLALIEQFDWSFGRGRDAYLQIFGWFISRAQYQILRPSLMAKVHGTLTCDPDKRPVMLRAFCHILQKIEPIDIRMMSYDNQLDVQLRLHEFIWNLTSLCQRLSPCNDEESRDVLFKSGLLPKIGACLERTQSKVNLLTAEKRFFDVVNSALRSLDGFVENKEEYLLHLAQHCVGLDREWTRREEVGAHLDARLVEEMLVREGPCTKCNEGSADKWGDDFLSVVLVQTRSLTVEQDPQPGPSTLTPSDSDSSWISASNTGPSLMPEVPLDVASAVDTPSGTTRPFIIATSLFSTATSSATTVMTRARALEVPPVSPAELDDLGSRVISQHEPASHGDETSDSPSIAPHPLVTDIAPLPDTIETQEAETLSIVVDIPGVELGTALPVSAVLETGQHHDEPVTHAPRVVTASAVSSPASDALSVAAVKPAAPDAASGLSSASAVSAATASRSVVRLSPDAAAMTRQSPNPHAAPSQTRTANVYAPSDSAEHNDIHSVDITTESSTE